MHWEHSEKPYGSLFQPISSDDGETGPKTTNLLPCCLWVTFHFSQGINTSNFSLACLKWARSPGYSTNSPAYKGRGKDLSKSCELAEIVSQLQGRRGQGYLVRTTASTTVFNYSIWKKTICFPVFTN